jgi:hypothetical protein
MRIALISIVALLGFLFPQMLLADGEAAEFTMTPRAQKIFDQAPKTPEELLKVITEFMDHPDMDGYEFVEKISGVDRNNWEFGRDGDGFGAGPKPRTNAIDGAWTNFHGPKFTNQQYQSLFYTHLGNTINEQGLLLSFGISGFKETPFFTAKELKAVFGEPKRVKVAAPWTEFAVPFAITYFYKTDKYRLYFKFYSKQEVPSNPKNMTVVKGFISRLRSFENHKNIPVVSIQIRRTKK